MIKIHSFVSWNFDRKGYSYLNLDEKYGLCVLQDDLKWNSSRGRIDRTVFDLLTRN